MPYLRAIGFLAALAVTYLFAVPFQWFARRYDWTLQHRVQTGFCRMMLAIIGIRVRSHRQLTGASPRFVVANHVSWTDILALASLYPLVFLAKKEVASWPVLGFLARLQGTVFVDRGNRRGIPQVNAALSEVLRAGRDVVVFAEGTSSDGASILKFNAAHFAMLCDLQSSEVPPPFILAPVGIAYTETDQAKPADIGWYGDMTFVPHLWSLMKRDDVVCHIAFGPPVETAGRDRKALAAAAETSVRALVQATRLSDEAPPKNSI
ncbi:lysophospholipid acyltransferase family protein [Bradyrhizobium sp.]|uniref:lysophospholipid acyltransferase family protein n=1 Tax=Bradyrhizobium sp. TaxID=376 RepID=UPI004037F274